MSDRDMLARTISGLLAARKLDDPRAGLWDELREHGLAHPFQSGVTLWSEAAAIIAEASRFAPALPLAENVLASFFLRAHKGELPGHRITVFDPLHTDLFFEDGAVRGTAALVPHSAVSSHALARANAEDGPQLVVIELRGVEAHPGESVASEPRDDLSIAHSPAFVLQADPGDLSQLLLLGALARATQIATLAETVLSMTIAHVKTRIQFDTSIASFQAVQHELAALGAQVAAAQTSVFYAAHCVDHDPPLTSRATQRALLSAKIQADRVAQQAIRTGHALHGAVGFAHEHALHRFTTRLMSYRAEFASGALCASWLGADVIQRGAPNLWLDLTQ